MKATRTSAVPTILAASPKLLISESGWRVFPLKIITDGNTGARPSGKRSTCDSCCRDRPERACYTPIPIRATSDTPRTVGWQCWTTAPQPSSRPDSARRRPNLADRASMRAMARRSLTACARKGSSSQTSTFEPILLRYLLPFIEPLRVEEFHYTREWMRGQFTCINDLRKR